MLTEKDYCDYDTCVALKELGYNRGAYAYYFPNHKEDLIFNTHQMRGCSINEMVKSYNTYPKDVMGHELIDAPTMWEAQKFLREEKCLHIEVLYQPACWTGRILDLTEWKYIKGFTFFESFEDTLHTLIKEAVKILKENETIHE